MGAEIPVSELIEQSNLLQKFLLAIGFSVTCTKWTIGIIFLPTPRHRGGPLFTVSLFSMCYQEEQLIGDTPPGLLDSFVVLHFFPLHKSTKTR